MTRPPSKLAALMLALAAFGSAPPRAAGQGLGERVDQARAVLCATSPDGARRAWLGPEGLVVTDRRSRAARIVLGDGHHARFDRDGRLVFERSVDDGHFVLSSRTWILERDAVEPRPLAPTERAPRSVSTPAPLRRAAGSPRVKLVVDAGHGGSDPGASGFGHEEADVVLDVALRLQALLVADDLDPAQGGDWEVMMTRSDDSTVSLAQRVDLANVWGADTFTSIHANAFGSPSANGTETYSYPGATTAATIRDRIQTLMVAAWGLTDRGGKTANFYVLRETFMPATLSELGFITSPVDIVKLTDPLARQEAAVAHLFALQQHHGFPTFDPYPAPEVTCTATAFAGCTPGVSSLGEPSASGPDDFVVESSNQAAGVRGVLLFGTAEASAPFLGGTLCVQPPLVRAALRTASGGAGCAGTFSQPVSQSFLAQHGFAPGATVYAQWVSGALVGTPGPLEPAAVGSQTGSPASAALSPALRFVVRP